MILNIGRNSKNDIVISDSEVSGFHAQIVSDNDNQVFINDLNSQNGTFVNGVQITSPRQLVPGDKVKLASCSFDWEQHIPSAQSSPENSVKNTNTPVNTPKKKSSLLKKFLISISVIIGILGIYCIIMLAKGHTIESMFNIYNTADLSIDCDNFDSFTKLVSVKVTNHSKRNHSNITYQITSYDKNGDEIDMKEGTFLRDLGGNKSFKKPPIFLHRKTKSCSCIILNSDPYTN